MTHPISNYNSLHCIIKLIKENYINNVVNSNWVESCIDAIWVERLPVNLI